MNAPVERSSVERAEPRIRAGFALALLAGLTACGEGEEPFVPGTLALLPQEAVGLFRYVCTSSVPRERLVSPFKQLSPNSYKHSSYDIEFSLSENGKSCTAVLKAEDRDKQSPVSTVFGNGERDAVKRTVEGLKNINPSVKVMVGDDLYITASI